MPGFIDLTGKKFGRLTVIRRAENHEFAGRKDNPRWVCVCECGEECIVVGSNLRSGNTKSCGCLNSESSRDWLLERWRKRKNGD